MPTLAGAAACDGNAMCQSDLCFCAVSGTPCQPSNCSVPLATACDPTANPPDCPVCMPGAWCSELCTGLVGVSGTCPDGFACLVTNGNSIGFCYVGCTVDAGAGCPGETTCQSFSSPDGGVDGYACF